MAFRWISTQECAPEQGQDLVGRHDEALLDGAVASPRVAVRLALDEHQRRLARAVGLELREFALDLHDFAVGEVVALGQLAVELF